MVLMRCRVPELAEVPLHMPDLTQGNASEETSQPDAEFVNPEQYVL